MYDNGLYQEVVDSFLKFQDVADHDELAVFMAALYKVGTEEAFEVASKFRHGHLIKRASEIYVLFAINQGEFAVADDLLYAKEALLTRESKPEETTTRKVTSNLILLLLVKSGRLEAAFKLLRERNRNFKNCGQKMKIPLEIMKLMSEAVKASEDQKLLREYSKLCLDLNECGELEDKTVENYVLLKTKYPWTKRSIEKPKLRNKTND